MKLVEEMRVELVELKIAVGEIIAIRAKIANDKVQIKTMMDSMSV